MGAVVSCGGIVKLRASTQNCVRLRKEQGGVGLR